MNLSKGQGELFTEEDYCKKAIITSNELSFNINEIKAWQKRIYNYQKSFLSTHSIDNIQKSLFNSSKEDEMFETFNPIKLTPLPLNFWQWPNLNHQGPAIYLVMDKLKDINSHIMLYVGETISAEKRWKGNHDCKQYIQAYCETCQSVGLATQTSIRFWKDVPTATKPRRALEQKLIKRWLPPFNKETRKHWSTPFTAEIN